MATMTSSAAVSIPAFTGLRSAAKAKVSTVSVAPSSSTKAGPIKASLKDFGVAAAAVAATTILAGNAMGMEVLLGGDDGSLAFVPGTFKVAAGEKIVFKNNAGFPHNVVFDEDAVPSGVDVAKISMSEEDYLNGPGETYAVTLTEKGEYSFYCAPHQGAGMSGKVIVE